MSRFANALQHESSPYLLQHAHNPVQWHAWNPETLQLAKDRNLPVLVSVGYAACHWCHVMERESFEDVVVARFMNEHFTNIKIDREERPDIDHTLMEAVQTMTGQGGWPLNVFLTPDMKPFYGGTYFPPERMHGRPSWLEVLQSIHRAWTTQTGNIQEQAGRLFQHLQNATQQWLQAATPEDNPVSYTAMAEELMERADKTYGGFGRAPKFPQWFSLQYLMAAGYFYNNPNWVNHVTHTLDQMIAGGIYDQAGGGIARYSTDEYWLVPHFEKMLYDQAFLITVLSEAYQLTQHTRYATCIQHTIRFLQQTMASAGEGYYAALDADSEGEEGKYYVWSYEELQEILGAEAVDFCNAFHVQPQGNWEGKNILHHNNSPFASGDTSRENYVEKYNAALSALLTERSKRIPPATDTKQLLCWNAMMVSAYCHAFAALQEDAYLDEATRLFQWLVQTFETPQGTLFHTFSGKATIEGFLDDYATLARASLDLFQLTGRENYLLKARDLVQFVLKHFYDAESGLFYYTADFCGDTVLRTKDLMDNAQAAGNSLMASVMLSVHALRPEWNMGNIAQRMLEEVQGVAMKYPASFAYWGLNMLKHHQNIYRIELSGGSFNTAFREILKIYLPNKVLQPNIGGQKKSGAEADLPENAVTISVCSDFTCFPPMGSVQELKNFINKDLIQ